MRFAKTGQPLLLIACAVLAVGCSGVTSAETPQQRAAAAARTLLAEFVPPPGAVRLTGRPALAGNPAMIVNSTTLTDAVGYWRARGAPTALLAWEKAHIARSLSPQDLLIGPPSWNTVYSLPAVPGVFPVREMNVQVYQAGGGMTVIMADAMVAWQPPRPATEVIPASVTVVTIAGSEPGVVRGNPAPVTITSVPVVRRLAALVNGLPVSTAGRGVPCNMAAGLTLTFRTAAGGPAAAVATGPAECGVVHLKLNGTDEPDLQPSSSYVAAALKIAGLPWNLAF